MTTAKPRGLNPDPLTLRLALLANLYEPLAVRGKAAVSDSWAAGEMTPERVTRETADHPHATNTGLRTGALVGVDIDVKDEHEAAAIKALVEGVVGPSPLVRVGRKGMLLCYQNPDPIRKITVGSSDRTKVEIMGVGQQVVAYGVHPGTGRPYEWIGEAEPVTCQLDWLPVARPAALRDLARRIATLLSERHPDVRVTGDMGEASPSAADDLSPVAGVPLPPAEIRARLFASDPACGREAWRDLAASLRATPCSDPAFDRRALFIEWSRGGGAAFTGDDDCEEVFDTMPPKEALRIPETEYRGLQAVEDSSGRREVRRALQRLARGSADDVSSVTTRVLATALIPAQKGQSADDFERLLSNEGKRLQRLARPDKKGVAGILADLVMRDRNGEALNPIMWKLPHGEPNDGSDGGDE